jgi:hypothetical protein
MAIIDKSNNFFTTKLYTGNGSTQNITGLDFAPNWVWIKSRTSSRVHVLVDTVRGATKRLQTNEADAEATTSNSLTAFNSDGFSLGSYNQSNEGSASFVSWNWKANGSGSANTAGSINSVVSVNTTSRFSIVSYTGTGSNATIGHGLGLAPAMVITKRLSAADDWIVWQKGLTNPASYLYLNGSNVEMGSVAAYQNITPTSTLLYPGTDGRTNANGQTYISYCFADVESYSKFGKYRGNGSSNGQVVYTGFSPAFVIIKNIDAGESWMMFDNQRLTFNQTNGRYQLQPNTSSAEYQGAPLIDFLSGGFKLTTNTNSLNVAQNYIYMAFAANPFVTSTDNNSIPGPAV